MAPRTESSVVPRPSGTPCTYSALHRKGATRNRGIPVAAMVNAVAIACASANALSEATARNGAPPAAARSTVAPPNIEKPRATSGTPASRPERYVVAPSTSFVSRSPNVVPSAVPSDSP